MRVALLRSAVVMLVVAVALLMGIRQQRITATTPATASATGLPGVGAGPAGRLRSSPGAGDGPTTLPPTGIAQAAAPASDLHAQGTAMAGDPLAQPASAPAATVQGAPGAAPAVTAHLERFPAFGTAGGAVLVPASGGAAPLGAAAPGQMDLNLPEDPPQPPHRDRHLAGGVWVIGGPSQRPWTPTTPAGAQGNG